MPLCQHIQLMATYNADMNAKVYAAAGKLSAEDLKLDRQAFFGSILGTLNHLLVADLIWLKRFAGHPAQYAALQAIHNMEIPEQLNAMPHDALETLASQRQQLDQIIKAFASSIQAADLAQALTYHTLTGEPMRKNMFSLLMHFFNHQTHHRGQVSTLLFQAGIDIGVTDLNAWIASC